MVRTIQYEQFSSLLRFGSEALTRFLKSYSVGNNIFTKRWNRNWNQTLNFVQVSRRTDSYLLVYHSVPRMSRKHRTMLEVVTFFIYLGTLAGLSGSERMSYVCTTPLIIYESAKWITEAETFRIFLPWCWWKAQIRHSRNLCSQIFGSISLAI